MDHLAGITCQVFETSHGDGGRRETADSRKRSSHDLWWPKAASELHWWVGQVFERWDCKGEVITMSMVDKKVSIISGKERIRVYFSKNVQKLSIKYFILFYFLKEELQIILQLFKHNFWILSSYFCFKTFFIFFVFLFFMLEVFFERTNQMGIPLKTHSY